MASEMKERWFVGALPPAEWRYISNEAGETVASVAEWNDDGLLARNFCGYEAAKANATLIAAAPELLAALKSIMAHVEIPRESRGDNWHREGARISRIAEAAIAKAEGRTP